MRVSHSTGVPCRKPQSQEQRNGEMSGQEERRKREQRGPALTLHSCVGAGKRGLDNAMTQRRPYLREGQVHGKVCDHDTPVIRGCQDGLGRASVILRRHAEVDGPVPLELHEGIVARGGADLAQQSGAHLREPQLRRERVRLEACVETFDGLLQNARLTPGRILSMLTVQGAEWDSTEQVRPAPRTDAPSSQICPPCDTSTHVRAKIVPRGNRAICSQIQFTYEVAALHEGAQVDE